MTTPSGQISLNDVNVELGKSGTTTIALGNSDVRGLAGVASGQISMNDLRGKSSVVNLSYTFSSNTADASLNLSSLSGYSAGKTNFTVTINSGVYLYATSNSSYGLNITGGAVGDTLVIVNNGYIMGKGGKGAYYGVSNPINGGTALNLGFAMTSCTINNTNSSAYIGGGGGGGGCWSSSQYKNAGGGGAGGGDGGTDSNGGGVGSSGGNGTSSTSYAAGGGGGRVFPGVGATTDYVSASGNGVHGTSYFPGRGGTGGGAGGGWTLKSEGHQGGNGGSSNSSGGTANYAGGGGGGWGASGGNTNGGSGGGSGGKAVNTNGKSVTWASGDTARIWGSVS